MGCSLGNQGDRLVVGIRQFRGGGRSGSVFQGLGAPTPAVVSGEKRSPSWQSNPSPKSLCN